MQVEGAVGLRVQENKDRTETAVMFFRRDHLSPEMLDQLAEIRRLLNLPDGRQEFTLVYSPVAGEDTELGVGSRSMLQIMSAMASYTDVPEADLKDGRALPSLTSTNIMTASTPVQDQVQPGQTGGRLCRRALPRPMVLGG